MYPKLVTEKIVEYWAKGLSANETQKALQDSIGIRPNLNTIYKHRHSLTARHLIEELLRQQERAILKQDTDNPEVAMRYRNELLKILLPQKILSYERQDINVRNENVNPITSNLSEYDSAIEEELTRISKANRTRQPVDSDNP